MANATPDLVTILACKVFITIYGSTGIYSNTWNSLPNVVVLASSLDTFKTDLIGSGVIKMLNMITLLN